MNDSQRPELAPVAKSADLGADIGQSGLMPSIASLPALGRVMEVDERLLPSFFIVGPPRTGSSWLHETLSAHTVLPTPWKETRFFDTHFQRGMKWYLTHYKESKGTGPIGEVAPTYFASHLARERMVQTLPHAKIICVFRNPVERIVSLYRLKRAYGWIPWNFEEALVRDPELIESGRYVSNLRLWQQSFGKDNVMAGVYDDLRENPQGFVDSVVDFIGVPRFTLAESQCRLVHDSDRMTQPKSYYRTRSARLVSEWFKARRLDGVVTAFKKSKFKKLVLGGGKPFSQPPIEISTRLYDQLRPEVDQLETVLGRDLSAWKHSKTG
jgi:LPS sulfotransferase NodH